MSKFPTWPKPLTPEQRYRNTPFCDLLKQYIDFHTGKDAPEEGTLRTAENYENWYRRAVEVQDELNRRCPSKLNGA